MYAVGRFNEEINAGSCKYLKSCNAENFIRYNPNLKSGKDPKQGAVMCWEGKGSLAGHVCIVEKVIDKNTVYTSESAWNGKAFYNKTRSRGSNGNWGANSNYSFNGFLYNPEVIEIPVEPGVPRDETVDQVLVHATNLRVRKGPGTNNEVVAFVMKDNYYNFTDVNKESEDYTWYKIGEDKWIAQNKEETYLEVLPKVVPPEPEKLKVGDKVKIIGPYAGSANSKSAPHTYAIGWVRYITRIYEGANYPYQVGNQGDTSSKGTTGFCQESSLEKVQ